MTDNSGAVYQPMPEDPVWDPDDLYRALPEYTRRKLDKLTDKQREFVLLIEHGVDEKRAYRHAYDVSPNTKDVTVAANASKLRRTATIKKARLAIQQGSAAASMLNTDAPPMTKQWILERLAEEADPRKSNTGTVRVRALELLGRAHGLFEDVQVVKDERPQTAAEAKDRLMDILAKAGTHEIIQGDDDEEEEDD